MFKQTMIESNIWAVFQEAGFDTHTESYRIRFDEAKLKNTPGFQEIRSLNIPLETLSARRRNAKFGLINQLE
jgi:hypothetical protein